MALCTVADLEAFTQTDITNQTDPTILLYIGAAQSSIETFCDRKFDRSVGQVDTLDGQGDRTIRLDRYPIETMTSIVEDGVTLTAGEDFVFYENGRLTRLAGSTEVEGYWSTRRQSVVVTFTGGFEDGQAFGVPDDLRKVCATVAARSFLAGLGNADGPSGGVSGPVSGLTLEGVGSVKYATSASGMEGQSAGDAPALLGSEKNALSRYRRRVIVGGHKSAARW